MVDTVLSFEGERTHQFRILRALKNRFGPTDEIGVFEMVRQGLVEVANPSGLFLGDRDEGPDAEPGSAGARPPGVAGAVVFAGLEGSRPLLVEIQALVAPSVLGTPRRAVVGWDQARLAMILAVLEARAGVVLAGSDVFLNVAGGLRIGEAAADLAVAAALLSALTGRPLPAGTVVFGEIGLTGEIRAVPRPDARTKEAVKLGFDRVLRPARGRRAGEGDGEAVQVTALARLDELVSLFGADAPDA
jgi:DNA repair protein RadA/Sms